jgi:hypothetical protein
MKIRALYYTSFPTQGQGKKDKNWGCELLPIYYSTVVLDLVFDGKNPHYASRIKLFETRTKEIFYDKLTFLFLEMPKHLGSLKRKLKMFNHLIISSLNIKIGAFKYAHLLKFEKQRHELETNNDKWLYVFSHTLCLKRCSSVYS